ncbi:MAG: hypothetical protein ACK5PB_05525 [Pirellula sp.]|jgi:hypothetical protein
MKFVYLILFLLTGVHAHVSSARADDLVVTRDSDDKSRYRCDLGFATFTTPEDWNPNRSNRQTYVILTHKDENPPQNTKMISIDGGKPTKPTSKEMAQEFAKKWKGRILDKTVSLDGEEAYRVQCEPNAEKPQPIDCVVIVKDNRLLLIIAGATKKGEVEKAVDDLIATWKWKATETK